MVRTITVADGYNGATVKLSTRILDEVGHAVKLGVPNSYLIRWVAREEYDRKIALAEEADDSEPFMQGPDTQL